jgi:hypothetical protein
MHSFHHSRGRILFETACALTISASCVAAWMDLGVPALLAAAAVAALYGFVHLFDMRGRRPAVAFAAPAVELDAESQGDLLAYVDARAPELAPAASPSFVELVEDAAPVADPVAVEPEPAPEPRAKKRRPSKKAAPVAQPDPVAEFEPVEEEAPTVEFEAVEEIEAVVEVEPIEPPVDEEPEDHAPVTPLFEPEPFVRQQRAIFGRKAG